jgi:glycosyltransferase involved in cell wall biosynthesis
MVKVDYIFESSWEVCNKVGGIYTVLSSRAQTLKNMLGDRLVFIGPDLTPRLPDDFEEDGTLFADWKASLPENFSVRTGRWRTPGRPAVILTAYKTFFDRRDALYYEMWESFGVDSSHAYGDYDNSCIFAYAAALVIERFYHFYGLHNLRVAAIFNEWMLGMAALYIRKHTPAIATLFITHATTTGRSIACHDKPLYSCMTAYNGDQMARELNVEAKHSLEKQTARAVDCFATVSLITAVECGQLLGKAPDAVLPNGFEKGFVPEGDAYAAKRTEARRRLMLVTEKLTGRRVDDGAFLVATSGRYEYRNKGIDVFIDAMNALRKSAAGNREVVAFIMMPAWVYAARADLKYVIEKDYPVEAPLQMPFVTHWLHQMNDDRVTNFIRSSGFSSAASEKVRIIFVPCYLDGRDGIFNLPYYDLLIGMDATVFASYYEPWGYTPLESIAFGTPTVTTQLAGFGMWASGLAADITEGVSVVKRTDDNYFETVDRVAHSLLTLMEADARTVREQCFRLADKAEWSRFITHYYAAFDKAFAAAAERTRIRNDR